ncbi:GNAT family N-acetyltransferase [Brevibacillus sp. SYSU BS000544]|uniref:GNAT family N-acetyltransferase n=1 Tax=Brevibacillus sp. SYSU BS000544 TaxID=3416443 RepID=UPI003CE55134
MDMFTAKLIGTDCYLRLLTRDDAPAFLDYLERNKEYHEPFVPLRSADFFSMATAIQYTEQTKKVDDDQQYSFGIFTISDHHLIGKVTLSKITRAAFQNCYLGYDIDHEYTNRGMMTQAVQMVVSFALSALALHRIQASIMPRNVSSQRVVEKAGFVREGFCENYLQIHGNWEDHFIYAITSERYARIPKQQRFQGVIEWIQ